MEGTRTVRWERSTEEQRYDNVLEGIDRTRERGWKGESVIEKLKLGIERRGVSANERK